MDFPLLSPLSTDHLDGVDAPCPIEPLLPDCGPSLFGPSLPTPLQEDGPDVTFADAILPDVALSTPPLVKNALNLRLPSFDLLGIAAPHPDRIPLGTQLSFSSLGAGPLSKPEDPLHVLSPPIACISQLDGAADETSAPNPRAARVHVSHAVPVFTPPTEPGILNWGSFVNVTNAGLGSPPNSEPGVSPSLTTTAGAISPGAPSSIVVPIIAEVSAALGMAAWVQHVKELLGA
jgi:hypothetical protein